MTCSSKSERAKKKPRKKGANSKKKASPAFRLSVDSFEQFGFLSLTPPTKIEDVPKSVEELKAKKVWYSEQERGSVPTAREIRKANEKAAADVRSSMNKVNGSAAKKNGKISADDFAPLSAAGSTAAVNATWGQKPAEDEGEGEAAADVESELPVSQEDEAPKAIEAA